MKRLLPLLFVFAVNAHAELTILDDHCMTTEEIATMLQAHGEHIVSYGVSHKENSYFYLAVNQYSGSYTIVHESGVEDEACITDYGILEPL